MARLAFGRSGAGAPLVLLHALGLSRHTWDPVVPALAEHFDVIAVDLPGFGGSEPLPDGVEPSPAALAEAVAELLDELGVAAPHLAGNSLGGWVALELAGIRPVASLTLVAPAGLWRGNTPRYCRVSLRPPDGSAGTPPGPSPAWWPRAWDAPSSSARPTAGPCACRPPTRGRSSAPWAPAPASTRP
jgi:pimeloyl-ACP methyl ester carboxylesterase